MEEQINNVDNKEKNKRMLKTIGIEGGAAFIILFTCMLLTAIGKNANDNKQRQEEQQQQQIAIENAEKFHEALKYIANEQYKSDYSVFDKNTNDYKVLSLELKENTISYCFKTNFDTKLTNITISLTYTNADNCISLINENYTKTNYFVIDAMYMDIVTDSEIQDRFKVIFGKGENNDYIGQVTSDATLYSALNPDEIYASITYENVSKTAFFSYNKIIFNPNNGNINYNSGYVSIKSENQTMSCFFELIEKSN